MAENLEPVEIDINMRQNVSDESEKAAEGMDNMTKVSDEALQTFQKNVDKLTGLIEKMSFVIDAMYKKIESSPDLFGDAPIERLDAMKESTEQARQELEAYTESVEKMSEAVTEGADITAVLEDATQALTDTQGDLSGNLEEIIDMQDSVNTLTGEGEEETSAYSASNKVLSAVIKELSAALGIEDASIRQTIGSVQLISAAKNTWSRIVAMLSVNLGISTAACKLLLATGIGLLLAGVVAIYQAYQNWNEKQEESNFLAGEAKNLYNQATGAVQGQISKVQILENILKDSNRTYAERNNALKELKKIMPEYNASLSEEGKLIEDTTGIMKEYIETLKQTELAKVSLAKLAEAQFELLEATEEFNKMEKPSIWFDQLPKHAEYKEAEENIERLQKRVETYTNIATDASAANLKSMKEEEKATFSLIETKENLRKLVELMPQRTEEEITARNKSLKVIDDEINRLKKLGVEKEKVTEEDVKPTTGSSRKTSRTPKAADTLIKREAAYQTRIDAARVKSIEQGAEKERAAIKAEYDKTKAYIEQQYRELEQIEKITGRTAGSQRTKLLELDSAATDKYEFELNRINAESKKKTDKIFEEVNSRFRGELDNNLAYIKQYYDDLILEARRAGASVEEINRLNDLRNIDISRAGTEDKLRKAEFDQALAMEKAYNLEAVGLTTLSEQRKYEITKKYMQLRIELLRELAAAGDEEAGKEADLLEEKLKGMLSPSKGVKGLLNDSLFNSIKKGFENTGMSAEKAEEKTTALFSKFSQGGAQAVTVIEEIKTLFGGISEELDIALDAAMDIAKGFAQDGIVGGIEQAASKFISVTMNLLTAKKEVDKSMIEGYQAYIDAIDKLIDKQIESLKSLGAKGLSETLLQTVDDLNERMDASRRLFEEVARSGSGMFSRSLGYRANKMLDNYAERLRQAGIYTTNIYNMTNEQLIALQSIPEVWARLHSDLRKYIEDLADAKEELDGLSDQIRDMLFGFDYSNITEAIVSSFTDPTIDDAMSDLEGKVDEMIGNIIKNIITRNMLIDPIQQMVSDLWDSVDINGESITFDPAAMQRFRDRIMRQAEMFGDVWDEWEELFSGMGINLSGNSEETRQGASAGIERISQDSANELNGNFLALRQHVGDIRNLNREANMVRDAMLSSLVNIEGYTAFIPLLLESIEDMKQRGLKTK